MQRRWEEQLAGYVAASFRVLSLGNTASQTVQLVSKLVTAAILYFGAKLVIDGGLTVGELVAFNILAGRVSAPVLRLAQIWQDFHQARLSVQRLGDILNTTAEPTYTSGPRAAADDPRRHPFDHVSFRYRLDGPQVLHDVTFDVPAGQMVGIVGSVRVRQEHVRQARPASLRAGKRPRAGRRHRSRHGRPGLAAPPDRRRAAGERALQPLGARQHRARRSRRWRWSGSLPRHASPARTISSSNCRKATTRSSASAAPPSPAASASASPLPARWSPIRAS